MFSEHGEIIFKLHKLGIYCKLKQAFEGLTQVTFHDARGIQMEIPSGLKCYDKSSPGWKGAPDEHLGHVVNTIGDWHISLCTTNIYEPRHDSDLLTELILN